MRRLAAFISVATLILTGLMVAPASADKPVDLPEDTFVFVAPNPCTGSFHEISITVSPRLHMHRNSASLIISRTGMTSDGFLMQNGREIQHINFNSIVGGSTFMDLWVNPETGQKFRAAGVFVGEFANGPMAPPTAVKVDRFSLSCIGGETILPPPPPE